MSAPDASHNEMPGFPCPGRPGGEHDEPLLDMIFDGRAIPPDAPQEMHDLERMLAALAGPAEPGELAGEAAARAAFVRLTSPVGASPAISGPAAQRVLQRPASYRPASHRLARPRAARERPVRRRAMLPAALCAAAVVLAGAAAAYVGVLPGPIQQVAHVTVGAPAPRDNSPPPPARSGPRRDERHGLGRPGLPAPRPGGPADADRSPGQAGSAKPRHQPGGNGPKPSSSCAPGPWVDQGPPRIVPGVPPPSPRPSGLRCPDDPGKSAGRAANNAHKPS